MGIYLTETLKNSGENMLIGLPFGSDTSKFQSGLPPTEERGYIDPSTERKQINEGQQRSNYYTVIHIRLAKYTEHISFQIFKQTIKHVIKKKCLMAKTPLIVGKLISQRTVNACKSRIMQFANLTCFCCHNNVNRSLIEKQN